jgi:putative ABC transport system permease protein
MIWSDLNYSARTLTRNPGLSLTLLFTIALGIGSNAAIVGFVRGLVTRDLPIPDVDRTVSIFGRDAQGGFSPVSYDAYLSLRAEADVFELLGAARVSRSGVSVDGRSSVMSVAAITPELASLLQLPPRGGIVLSHRIWQNEFGGRANFPDQLISVDDTKSRIAGVAPEWLEGLYVGNDVDIWMPLDEGSLQPRDRSRQTFWVVGRLRPGVSRNRAQAALNGTRNGPDIVAVLSYTAMTPEVSSGMLRMGTLLSAAAAAVFFIACVNVATFLLSRASARSLESSVRIAIGASRGRLAQHLLADAIVLSVIGGALGLVLAVWTTRAIPSFLFEQDAEQLVFVSNLPATLTASAACVAIMIVCGLVPLFETRHDDPATVLRRECAGPSTAMRQVRAGLVMAQMTCCCLLVVSAAILLTGFRSALQTRMGQHLRGSILATLEARHRFSRSDLGLQYFHEAERAAMSSPGTVSAAWSGTPPGSRPGWQSIRIEPAQLPMRDVVLNVAAFTPESLAHIVVPPVSGRMFGGGDTPQSCRVVIVNEQAAKDVFGGDAVGRAIQDPSGQRVEIVGVVATREAVTSPTIYYYADQTSPPTDRVGPAHFQFPIRPQPVRGVLESNVVSPGYFAAMSLTPTAGTVFSSFAPTSGCRVGVINQEANELYFGGNGVGAAVIDTAGRRTEVIGVVRSLMLRTAQRRADPAIYLPMTQDFLPLMTLILQTREANDATLASVRRTLDDVPGGARPAVVRTLEQHLSRIALAPERIATVLVGASAVTALALGVLGLYGAMSDATRQRRREFGVRVALGAKGWRLIREVLAEGIRLAATGAVAGLLGSLLVARWLARVTPNAGPLTIWVWLLAPLALLISVVIASVLPARQALATDPLTIMRNE